MSGFDTPIDYAIPFVNCNDAEWLREYRKHVPEVSDWSNNSTRFRDWDTIHYQVCMLVKAKFSPSEIDILLGVKHSYASHTRKRLHLTIFGYAGSGEDFDKKILTIM